MEGQDPRSHVEEGEITEHSNLNRPAKYGTDNDSSRPDKFMKAFSMGKDGRWAPLSNSRPSASQRPRPQLNRDSQYVERYDAHQINNSFDIPRDDPQGYRGYHQGGQDYDWSSSGRGDLYYRYDEGDYNHEYYRDYDAQRSAAYPPSRYPAPPAMARAVSAPSYGYSNYEDDRRESYGGGGGREYYRNPASQPHFPPNHGGGFPNRAQSGPRGVSPRDGGGQSYNREGHGNQWHSSAGSGTTPRFGREKEANSSSMNTPETVQHVSRPAPPPPRGPPAVAAAGPVRTSKFAPLAQKGSSPAPDSSSVGRSSRDPSPNVAAPSFGQPPKSNHLLPGKEPAPLVKSSSFQADGARLDKLLDPKEPLRNLNSSPGKLRRSVSDSFVSALPEQKAAVPPSPVKPPINIENDSILASKAVAQQSSTATAGAKSYKRQEPPSVASASSSAPSERPLVSKASLPSVPVARVSSESKPVVTKPILVASPIVSSHAQHKPAVPVAQPKRQVSSGSSELWSEYLKEQQKSVPAAETSKPKPPAPAAAAPTYEGADILKIVETISSIGSTEDKSAEDSIVKRRSAWGQGLIRRATSTSAPEEIKPADQVADRAPTMEQSGELDESVTKAKRSFSDLNEESAKEAAGVVKKIKLESTSSEPAVAEVDSVVEQGAAEEKDSDEVTESCPHSQLSQSLENSLDIKQEPVKEDPVTNDAAEEAAKKAQTAEERLNEIKTKVAMAMQRDPNSKQNRMPKPKKEPEVDGRKKRGRPFGIKNNQSSASIAEGITGIALGEEEAPPEEEEPRSPGQQREARNKVLPRSGRTGGRQSNRVNDRLQPQEEKASSSGSAGGHKLTNKEKKLMKERQQLCKIFSRDMDISRALQGIYLMNQLVKGHADSTYVLQQQDLTSAQAASRVLMPATYEINLALDMLEQNADGYYQYLKGIREKQYMSEVMLKEQESAAAGASSGAPVAVSVSEQGGSNLSKEQTTMAPVAATKGSLSIGSKHEFSVAPNLAEMAHNNSLRIVEAHLFATIVSNNQPLSSDAGAPVAVAASATAEKEVMTVDDAAAKKGASAPLSVMESVQQFVSGAVPLYSAPQELPSFQTTRDDMENKRAAIAQEIRRRKMSTRRAWEVLGDQYLSVQHKWNAHVGELEVDEEQNAGPKLRGTYPTYNSNAKGGVGIEPSATTRSNNLFGYNINAKPPLFPSAALNTALAASSHQSNELTRLLETAGGGRMSIARADYEQDKLLQQLLSKELRQQRIENGLCSVPDMRTPWPYADQNKLPPEPKWTSQVREITTAGDKRRKARELLEKNDDEADSDRLASNTAGTPLRDAPKTELEYPRYQHGLPEFIDCNSSRLTTDGKRQFCASFAINAPCPPNCNCAFQVDRLQRFDRLWTDMEKCIFLDKFLQFPKNFNKIASFLHNRSTKDCIKFYYDAKHTLEFKALLKEFDNRRKLQKCQWLQTVKAAHMVGTAVYPSSRSDNKESLIELPLDDSTFCSFANQPMNMSKIFNIPISRYYSRLNLDGRDDEPPLTGRNISTSVATVLSQPYPRLETIAMAERKLVERNLAEDHEVLESEIQDTRAERQARYLMETNERFGNGVSKTPLGVDFTYVYNPERVMESMMPYHFFNANQSSRVFYTNSGNPVSVSNDIAESVASSGKFQGNDVGTAKLSSNSNILSMGNGAGRKPGPGRGGRGRTRLIPGGGAGRGSIDISTEGRGGAGGRGPGRGRGRIGGRGRGRTPLSARKAESEAKERASTPADGDDSQRYELAEDRAAMDVDADAQGEGAEQTEEADAEETFTNKVSSIELLAEDNDIEEDEVPTQVEPDVDAQDDAMEVEEEQGEGVGGEQ